MKKLRSQLGRRKSDHPEARPLGVFSERNLFDQVLERAKAPERMMLKSIVSEAMKGGNLGAAFRNYLRDTLFRSTGVNERITFLLTKGTAFGFQEAMTAVYNTMVDPDKLVAFTRAQEEGRFRGFFEVRRENGKTVMLPHREVISVADDWLIQQAVERELICLASPSRRAIYTIDRKNPFDGVQTFDIKRGNFSGEQLAISFEGNIGLVNVTGKNLTFGDIFFPEEEAIRTALLISRIGALDMNSRRDSLTGLCTRAEFSEVYQYLAQHFMDTGENTAVVMLDLDHFKRINDDHGHLVGDTTLVKVADKAVSVFRATDFLGIGEPKSEGPGGLLRSQGNVTRFGGEEIIVLLPGAELDDAIKACLRAKSSIASIEVVGSEGKMIGVTASMGVTTLKDAKALLEAGEVERKPDWDRKPEIDLIMEGTKQVADEGVYAAKKAGRNTVVGIGFDEETGKKQVHRRN